MIINAAISMTILSRRRLKGQLREILILKEQIEKEDILKETEK